METDVRHRITAILHHFGINKSEMAIRMGMDSNSTIVRIANGKVNPSYEVLKKMAEAFPEINFNWLITGEGEMLSGFKPEKKLDPTEREIFQYMKNQLEEQKKMIDFLMEQVRQNRETLSNNHKKTEE